MLSALLARTCGYSGECGTLWQILWLELGVKEKSELIMNDSSPKGGESAGWYSILILG